MVLARRTGCRILSFGEEVVRLHRCWVPTKLQQTEEKKLAKLNVLQRFLFEAHIFWKAR